MKTPYDAKKELFTLLFSILLGIGIEKEALKKLVVKSKHLDIVYSSGC